jgi:hypothetical protein
MAGGMIPVQVDLETNNIWLDIVDDLPNITLRWREIEHLSYWDRQKRQKIPIRGVWTADCAVTIHARIEYDTTLTSGQYTTEVRWDGHTRIFATKDCGSLLSAKASAALSVKLLLAERILECTRVPVVDGTENVSDATGSAEDTQPHLPRFAFRVSNSTSSTADANAVSQGESGTM